MIGVPDDVIILRIFSFSLRDKEKSWYQTLQVGPDTTGDEVAQKFLLNYKNTYEIGLSRISSIVYFNYF